MGVFRGQEAIILDGMATIFFILHSYTGDLGLQRGIVLMVGSVSDI